MHVLIVDVSFMLRRAQHVDELHNMATTTNIPTGGLYSLCSSIVETARTFACDSLVLCFDHGHSKRRMEVYDSYKDKGPAEQETDEFGMTPYQWFKHQVGLCKALFNIYGVKMIDIVGKEADDNVWQVCKMLKCKKTLITEDKDYYAFIDENTSVYRPIRKQYITLDNFYAMTGCKTPKHFLMLKCLTGDPSDCIPGCCAGVAGGTYSKIVDMIGEDEEVTPQTVLKYATEMAGMKGGSRAKKILASAEFLPNLNRNINLIDVDKEQYDFFQLETIREELMKRKDINVMDATKFFASCEFNPQRSRQLHNVLSDLNQSLEDEIK